MLPDDAALKTRPIFGNLAAFVNGNMFARLFGEDLFVRVADADRDRLIEEGCADFAPMAGSVEAHAVAVGRFRSRQDR